MPNELTNPNNVVTEERLAQFYQQILPYLGGMPDVLANKFNRADLYSTDEKLIGRWINGKPLYQRIIKGLNFLGSSASGSWHYITDFQTDFELNGNVGIVVDAVALRTNDSLVFRGGAFRYNKTNRRLEYCSNIAFSNCNMLILRYTKTTDSAVEIGDDTDYSTTEKIVGTWIDGKPVYQKTVENVTLNPTWNGQYYAYAYTSILIPDVENIINAVGIGEGKCISIDAIIDSQNSRWQICGNEVATLSSTHTYVFKYTKTSS